MYCALCGEKWEGETVSFSAVCENCHCWLHSCVQCALWDANSGMCRSSTTDSLADREGKNFCEEWRPHSGGKLLKTETNTKNKFDELFGN